MDGIEKRTNITEWVMWLESHDEGLELLSESGEHIFKLLWLSESESGCSDHLSQHQQGLGVRACGTINRWNLEVWHYLFKG